MSGSQPFRLAAGGALIDRSSRLRFRFNGKEYEGHAGDTLASALMANGVRLVGRSFKYHRPRGIAAAGTEEPNAIVQLDGEDDEPNARATTLALREGLSARSVNCWPGVGFDLSAINDWLSSLLPAGFYYKTFMGFPGGWNFYGPLVRRMAGLGTSPRSAGRQAYEKRFHHCDVLVAGAGPAGLQAALAAARSGARVMVADDGITFRLGENRWWMFAGTGAADHVHRHLERLLQIEWPELKVYLTVVTSQWTNVCVCGPKAKAVLEAAGTDASLAPDAFPFMTMREMTVAGIPARVARVGYIGELSFEINVPARHGVGLWESLAEAGKPFGLTLVGSDASMVMRCEKGFVSAGFEGDGIVNPFDAGCGWAVDMDKEDFIGRRSLVRDRNVGGVRPNVVGLLPDDASFVPPDGTPLVPSGAPADAPPVIGYVSQACHSPNVGRAIALAVLDDGRRRIGKRIELAAIDRRAPVLVTRPCFVDPGGARMRG